MSTRYHTAPTQPQAHTCCCYLLVTSRLVDDELASTTPVGMQVSDTLHVVQFPVRLSLLLPPPSEFPFGIFVTITDYYYRLVLRSGNAALHEQWQISDGSIMQYQFVFINNIFYCICISQCWSMKMIWLLVLEQKCSPGEILTNTF